MTTTKTDSSPGATTPEKGSLREQAQKAIAEYEWTPERIANRDKLVARMRKRKSEASTN